MNSILNSISSGDLRVQDVPGVIPVHKESIIDLLNNSKIEFNTCPKSSNSLQEFNTGFGVNNSLHFHKCNKPKLKTPLYLENYLREFKTEEEKAAARNSLGLYNRGDVVTNSLLTLENYIPKPQDLEDSVIKVIHLGDLLISPVVTTNSIYTSSGITLTSVLEDINNQIKTHTNKLQQYVNPTDNVKMVSLGDIQTFIKGFNNGDDLYTILDDITQEMLRFEKTGKIR